LRGEGTVVFLSRKRLRRRKFSRRIKMSRADQAEAVEGRSAFLVDSCLLRHKVIVKVNRSGFTLAEAMMATVVLGIAVTGILLPFTSGAMERVEGIRRTLGSQLASDLMEEIVRTPFEQIVSSYNGYRESEGQIKDAWGQVFTGSNYAHLSRDVSCEYVYVPQESGTTEAKFILATVRVYYRGREIAILRRLISG